MLINNTIPVVVSNDILYDSGWITVIGNSLQTTYWTKKTLEVCDVKVLKRVSTQSLSNAIQNNTVWFKTGTSNYFNGAVSVADGSCISSLVNTIYAGETYIVKANNFISTGQNTALAYANALSDLTTASFGAGTDLSITSNGISFTTSMAVDFRVVFLKPRERFL